MNDSESRVIVGRIGAPHGVRGWVNVQSFTTPVDNVLRYRPWILEDCQGQLHRVDDFQVAVQGGRLRALLAGVATRDAATSLRGRMITVPAAALPEPAADEYYWRDLIGMRVVDAEGRSLGAVRELLETGADDVLVVTDEAGNQTLIPFHRKFVHQVDLTEKVIRVDWLEPD